MPCWHFALPAGTPPRSRSPRRTASPSPSRWASPPRRTSRSPGPPRRRHRTLSAPPPASRAGATPLPAGPPAAGSLPRVRAGAGETVLVHGASGAVGISVLQQARLKGITIVGTASEHNFALLRQAGAKPIAYGPGLLDRVR